MSKSQPYGRHKEASTTLHVELFYEQPPRLDAAEIARRVTAALPDSTLAADTPGDPLLFLHGGHAVEYQGGHRVPPQTAVLVADEDAPGGDHSAELDQTWDWPEARSIVSRCKPYVLVTELMARSLDYKTRLLLFQTVLLACVEVTGPAAIAWTSAGKFVDPAAFRRASGGSDPNALTSVALNVRMFRIENHGSGDTVMDTCGLAAFGLPDLQVHFRGLEPARVAPHLFNAALYLYQNGDVIEDGHTIAGLDPGQKWRCQREVALIGPEREVLDLDPGPPYAAGIRS